MRRNPRHAERPRGVRAFALFALALMLAASCTAEPERDVPDVDGAPTEASPDDPVPTVPTDVAALGGRLVVVDSAGNLVTMRPDGTDEVVLAQVVPGRSQVQQPTWSPDGTRVAWVHVEASEDRAWRRGCRR